MKLYNYAQSKFYQPEIYEIIMEEIEYYTEAGKKKTKKSPIYMINVGTRFEFKNKTYVTDKQHSFYASDNAGYKKQLLEMLKIFKVGNNFFSDLDDNEILEVHEDDFTEFFAMYFLRTKHPFTNISSALFSMNHFLKSLPKEKNVITFKNKSVDVKTGNIVASPGEIIFKCNYMDQNEEYDNIIETLYSEIYGYENLQEILKIYSTFCWTKEYIKKFKKVMFLITEGNEGKSTFYNNVNRQMVIRQPRAMFRERTTALKNGYQDMGSEELEHGHINTLDDSDLRITTEWLKDQTKETFTIKPMGKNTKFINNVLQTTSINNISEIDLDKNLDSTSLKRLYFVFIPNTRPIEECNSFDRFLQIPTEYLISYFVRYFINNKNSMFDKNKKVDINKFNSYKWKSIGLDIMLITEMHARNYKTYDINSINNILMEIIKNKNLNVRFNTKLEIVELLKSIDWNKYEFNIELYEDITELSKIKVTKGE